jgi:small subunit ribosomal protein S19
MARSLKKGPFVDESLLKKIQSSGKKAPIRTYSRDSVITPEMVGYAIGVYNGKDFIEVKVVEEMVGHRLGEFSPTRKFRRHGGKMAREQEKAGLQKAAVGATETSKKA